VKLCGWFIRKFAISLLLLVIMTAGIGVIGKRVPGGFLPEEDQGYLYAGVQLPDAASLQRTDAATRDLEKIIMETPGVQYCTTVDRLQPALRGDEHLQRFFLHHPQTLARAQGPEEKYAAIMASLNRRMGKHPQGVGLRLLAAGHPGHRHLGRGDLHPGGPQRQGHRFPVGEHAERSWPRRRKRPEIARVTTTFLPTVPQIFVDVDRDKVLKQGVDLNQVFRTLQAFMGGYFINYFNRFGRQWQVYVQAEGEYRTQRRAAGQFYVRNSAGDTVPLSALTSIEQRSGPEFTMRYNLYRSAQLNVVPAPGSAPPRPWGAGGGVRQSMPREMGYDYLGMSFQEKKAMEGVPVSVIFGLSCSSSS
jgi:hydrophobic/amphiphilic exporter-1 (mainly G- bacteria), HAE1 family